MRNNTCVICGETFEPREGKLYCSDKCKQTAYYQNKKSDKLSQEKQEIKMGKPKPIYKFRLSEYQEYIEKFKNGIPIEEYFFLRRNLSGNPNLDYINYYINKIYDDRFYNNLDENGTPENTEFIKFKELLFGGYIEIQ